MAMVHVAYYFVVPLVCWSINSKVIILVPELTDMRRKNC